MFERFRPKAKFVRRLGAFSRAKQDGATEAEARAYTDQLYPPTPADIAFEERERRAAAEQSVSKSRLFPLVSTAALVYAAGAGAWMYFLSSRQVVPAIGYGVSMLGYALLAAGVFSGRFGVLGLRGRGRVLAAGILITVAGLWLVNR